MNDNSALIERAQLCRLLAGASRAPALHRQLNGLAEAYETRAELTAIAPAYHRHAIAPPRLF